MKISHRKMMEDFYKEVKDDYPDLTYEEIRDIVSHPWKHVIRCFANGKLDVIRLKYFGKFEVAVARAKGGLKKAKEKYDNGLITEEKYNKIKTMIDDYLAKKDK